MMTTLHNRVSALFADPLQSLLNEIQPQFTPPANGNGSTWHKVVAPLSLWEDGEAVYLEMDLPGFALEDLDVAIHKGRLTIKGQRKAPHPVPQFAYQERFFGEFERSVMLDEWVDPSGIEAQLRDGVLRLRIGKKPEAQRQQIAVNYSGVSEAKRIDAQET
jgi:HSP20 family protein